MTTITLEIRKQSQAAVTLTFNDGSYIIGREAGDIVLEDSLASAKHAELVVENGRVTFTDSGSTNGSFDNGGARIAGPYSFIAGGEIRMGNCTLALIQIDAPSLQGKTELAPAMSQPPIVQAHPAASAPASQAIPSKQPSSPGATGLWSELMEMLTYARDTLRPNIVQILKPILVLTLPLPLIVTILGLFAFIVPILGPIFFIIISLLLLLLSIPITLTVVLFVYPVIARFIISLHQGAPITMKEAWGQYKQDLSSNVLNTFVTTLIGGLTLGLMGVYIFQIPPIEKRSMVDVNKRSWELLTQSWRKALLAIIGTALLFFIPAHIASFILAFIPILGAILSTLILGVTSAVYFAVIMLLITRIYFEIKEKQAS